MASDVTKQAFHEHYRAEREKPGYHPCLVKRSDDWLSETLNLSKEQECNIVLLGVSCHRLNPGLCQKYFRLKATPPVLNITS